MKLFFVSIIGTFFLLQSCCTGKVMSEPFSSCKNYFIVSKVKKKKNNVYIIYAERNDSVFKIFSHFNGKIGRNDIKLKKGSLFKAKLISQFKSVEKKINMMSSYGISIIYYGVVISKESKNNIQDVYSCEELNGRFIYQKKH